MGRRRNPVDIVKIKEDIRDGLLKIYISKGVLRHDTYTYGHTIYLEDVQTGETVNIGSVNEM